MRTKCFSISYVYSRCFEFQNKYFSKHMKSRNVENHVWDGCWNKKTIEPCTCMLLPRRVICDNGFGFMENCVIDYETRLKNAFVDS